MYEFFLVPFLASAAYCLWCLMQSVVFLLAKEASWSRTMQVFSKTGTMIFMTYIAWVALQNIAHPVDYVLLGLASLLCISTVGAVLVSFNVRRKGNHLTMVEKQLLAVFPSVVWATFWLSMWRLFGPLMLPFFGKMESSIRSLEVATLISTIILMREYVSNLRHVEAKMAEIITFFGRRTGDAITEGFDIVPGVLPLVFQVVLYSLFRFTFFWSVVRGFVVPPIHFSGELVAYTRDRKAVVFSFAGRGSSTKLAVLDDLREDGAADPYGGVRGLIMHQFMQGASAFMLRYSWQELADGTGFRVPLMNFINQCDSESGFEIKDLNITWRGFHNKELGDMFQRLASMDFHRIDNSVKLDLLCRLWDIMKQKNPETTFAEAERVFEAFTKEGRGSFRFEFGT